MIRTFRDVRIIHFTHRCSSSLQQYWVLASMQYNDTVVVGTRVFDQFIKVCDVDVGVEGLSAVDNV